MKIKLGILAVLFLGIWYLLDPVIEVTERYTVEPQDASGDVSEHGSLTYFTIGGAPDVRHYGVTKKRHWTRSGNLILTINAADENDKLLSISFTPSANLITTQPIITLDENSRVPLWSSNANAWQWAVDYPGIELGPTNFELALEIEHCEAEICDTHLLTHHLNFSSDTRFHLNSLTKLIYAS